jgi:GT2 family glycosyltransferase
VPVGSNNPATPMLLSIIIVSYNTQKLTLQTLESALKDIETSSFLGGETEVIVVDNKSSDDSVSVLRQFIKTSSTPISLIENSTNAGFAQANNLGIKQSTGKYVFLLNSDTLVQDGALTKMVQAMENSPQDEVTAHLASWVGKLDKLGIVAPTLLNPNGTLQAQGGSFPTLLSLAVQMLFLDDLPIIGAFLPSTQHTGRNQRFSRAKHQQFYQQDWVGGTAMLIRRELLEETGLLDQNIFMYGEDIELCMRAKAHHWDVAIYPAAKITHYGSASSSSKNAILGELKGYLYIWAKHKPIWQMFIAKLILKLGSLLRWGIYSVLNQTEKASIYMTAIKDVLR